MQQSVLVDVSSTTGKSHFTFGRNRDNISISVCFGAVTDPIPQQAQITVDHHARFMSRHAFVLHLLSLL